MSEIKKPTALVIGGSSGIGREIVEQLLARGNTVIATGREPLFIAQQEKADLTFEASSVVFKAGGHHDARVGDDSQGWQSRDEDRGWE